MLRTFEAEIAENLRTSSFNLKNVVLIKKKNVYIKLVGKNRLWSKIQCTQSGLQPIFNQRSMKIGTHVLYEVPNQTISIFLAQPTKKASCRDFSKKPKKWDNF